mmetsp:Transcript_1610/g.5617  ORF Transcript_1610/g.5617 Transcript_1610/m.5617 type:complete len:121 (-) Transcript_1610:1508-1870(-)
MASVRTDASIWWGLSAESHDGIHRCHVGLCPNSKDSGNGKTINHTYIVGQKHAPSTSSLRTEASALSATCTLGQSHHAEDSSKASSVSMLSRLESSRGMSPPSSPLDNTTERSSLSIIAE